MRASLRGLDGLICPRCRYRLVDPTEGKLPRCPEHRDTVLVTPRSLSNADGDPFLGMIVGGRFAVLELLGAGSMGTVYRARQEAMGRDVALKIVRSDRLVDAHAKARFQQEAHATSLLTSPHTVTVFDFGEIEIVGEDPHYIHGSLFLAMELLEGESLGERLKRINRLPPEEVARIVRQTLLSLAEAHDKGVIHRDLKPDNLLLVPSPDGGGETCKVLDFGIAKVITHQGGIDAMETQAGTVFGTPRYMSPEQAQGKRLDARSDLYSLGVIMYHALLGRPPYTDSDAVVVMAHHIKTVPKRPSRVDPTLAILPELEDLLVRVLDKRPENRPQSAGEFIAALDVLIPPMLTARGNATGELTAVLGNRPMTAPQRRVLFAVGAATIGLGLAAAAATAMTLGRAAPAVAGEGLVASASVLAVRAVSEAQAEATPAQNEPKPGDFLAFPRPAASATTVVEEAPAAPPRRPRGYERFDK
jgi:serine/threonine-protein kinase